MDEFGETPTLYVWPDGHEAGEPIPYEFFQQVADALSGAGIAWEWV